MQFDFSIKVKNRFLTACSFIVGSVLGDPFHRKGLLFIDGQIMTKICFWKTKHKQIFFSRSKRQKLFYFALTLNKIQKPNNKYWSFFKWMKCIGELTQIRKFTFKKTKQKEKKKQWLSRKAKSQAQNWIILGFRNMVQRYVSIKGYFLYRVLIYCIVKANFSKKIFSLHGGKIQFEFYVTKFKFYFPAK